jgi:AcrR family transcriptional regulator
MKKRKYQLRRRAESQDETRRRIVEATVELHEKLGPRATTISAIAQRAGVQRLTVYRHFPDDTALFGACSAHWMARHPLPDAAGWRAHTDWRARCREAFAALYAYYRQNSGMLESIMRDADMPVMRAPMQGFADFYGRIQDDLLDSAGSVLARSKPFAETIRHALSLATWRSFAATATDAEIVALVLTWLDGIEQSILQNRAGRPTDS